MASSRPITALAVFTFLLANGLACRSATDDGAPINVAPANTGGSHGTGGKSGGGASKTGGASGSSTMVPVTGAGDPTGTPGADDAAAVPVADGATVEVAPVGAVDSAAPVADAPVSSPDTESAPDGGGALTKMAACWPDPKVIKICHQLENACENCPPGGAPPKNKTAQLCFDLIESNKAGKATDDDCAKFALANKCTVDNAATTGNICGSLNCGVGQGPPVKAGCDKVGCTKWQQWGDATKCQPYLAKCPCS